MSVLYTMLDTLCAAQVHTPRPDQCHWLWGYCAETCSRSIVASQNRQQLLSDEWLARSIHNRQMKRDTKYTPQTVQRVESSKWTNRNQLDHDICMLRKYLKGKWAWDGREEKWERKWSEHNGFGSPYIEQGDARTIQIRAGVATSWNSLWLA